MNTRRQDPFEAFARTLAVQADVDPDSRIVKSGGDRGQPAWCDFRNTARELQSKLDAQAATTAIVNLQPQADR